MKSKIAETEWNVIMFCGRLGSVKTTSSKFDLRVRIRERLLHILRNYSVYDKVDKQINEINFLTL